MTDDLSALLSRLQADHEPRAEAETLTAETRRRIARLGSVTTKIDTRTGEREEDDATNECSNSGGVVHGGSGSGHDGRGTASGSAQDVSSIGEVPDAARDRIGAVAQFGNGTPDEPAQAPPPCPRDVAHASREPALDPYSPNLRQYTTDEIIAFTRRAIIEAQQAIQRTDHLFQEKRS